MTAPQRIHLMAELWPRACQAQQWDRNDRALRLQILSAAVGRPLQSANDLDRTGDFDAVKRHLLTLADNIKAAAEQDHEGEARRTMHHVRQLLGELEELVAEPGAYVMALIRDITRGRYGVNGIEDLGTGPRSEDGGRRTDLKISELEQFRITLNARIHGKNGLLHGIRRQTTKAPRHEVAV